MLTVSASDMILFYFAPLFSVYVLSFCYKPPHCQVAVWMAINFW